MLVIENKYIRIIFWEIQFCKEPIFFRKGRFVNQNNAELNFSEIVFAQTQVTKLVDWLWDNSAEEDILFQIWIKIILLSLNSYINNNKYRYLTKSSKHK